MWVGARLLGFVFPLAPLPFGVVFFPLLVLTLIWVDISISGERVFYGNLGIRPTTVAAIVLPTVASLEVLAGLALMAATR